MALRLEPWWRDAWWVGERDRAHRIARMTRGEARFADPVETEALLDDLDRRVSLLVTPAEWGIIVDLRAVPLRASPDDDGVRRFNAIVFRFGRIAVVVGTAIGRMQMQRLARTTPSLAVFDTPEEAAAELLAWQVGRRRTPVGPQRTQ